MKEHEMYFANHSWLQLEAVQAAPYKTVLLLPVGATEPHGPHSPVATDMLISDGTSRRVVQALADDPEMRALILPPISYAVTFYSREFPGAVNISADTFHNMVVDVCKSLINSGWPYIMLVNNHFEPEHVQTIHRCLDTLQAECGVQVGFMDLTRKERARRLMPEFWQLGTHASRYETDLILADWPELVDQKLMKTLPPVPVNLVKVIGAGLKEFKAMGLTQAYNGDPAAATAAEGREQFAILAEMLQELMRQLVRGTGGRDLPGFYNRVPGAQGGQPS